MRRAVIPGIVLLTAAWLALHSLACTAPMCRTSQLRRGFTMSAWAGPTGFQSAGIISDTSSWWGGRVEPMAFIGGQADLRVGYGFTRWLGADFSAGMSYGAVVDPPESLSSPIPGSSRLAAAVLFRPWEHNNLTFVEYQLPDLFCVGWVTGLPARGRENWSVMAQVGIVPFYVSTHGVNLDRWDILPDVAQLAVRRDFSVGRGTLGPALGGTVAWDWVASRPALWNVTLGAVWSSPSLFRRGS